MDKKRTEELLSKRMKQLESQLSSLLKKNNFDFSDDEPDADVKKRLKASIENIKKAKEILEEYEFVTGEICKLKFDEAQELESQEKLDLDKSQKATKEEYEDVKIYDGTSVKGTIRKKKSSSGSKNLS